MNNQKTELTTAKIIRNILKEQFKDTKFSVRILNGLTTECVKIKWHGGPSFKDIFNLTKELDSDCTHILLENY